MSSFKNPTAMSVRKSWVSKVTQGPGDEAK